MIGWLLRCVECARACARACGCRVEWRCLLCGICRLGP